MSTETFKLPKGFEKVLLVLAGMNLQAWYAGFKVSGYRRKIFNQEFMDKNFGEVHQNELKDYEYIIISDIYPGRPVLERLPDVHWFDHKQNSKEKIKQHKLKLPNAVVETEVDGRPTSGSELLFRWLKELNVIDDKLSSFVEYVRELDAWDH